MTAALVSQGYFLAGLQNAGKAGLSVVLGLCSVPRVCTSAKHTLQNSLHTQGAANGKSLEQSLSQSTTWFLWQLLFKLCFEVLQEWFFWLCYSSHQRYSVALVIVLLICKSDLKAVLVEQNLEKDTQSFTRRNRAGCEVQHGQEKQVKYCKLKRFMASRFLVLLLSWVFILIPGR